MQVIDELVAVLRFTADQTSIGRIGKQISRIKDRVNRVANQISMWGVGATATLAFLTHHLVGVTKAMNRFEAVSGATAEQMRRAKLAVERTGAQLPLMNKDIMLGMVSMIKLGASADEATQAIEAVSKAAVALDVEPEAIAQTALNLARVFDLPMSEMGRLMDQIVHTTNVSAANFQDIGLTIAHAAPGWAALGDNTASLLAVAGLSKDLGQRGETAATMLKMFTAEIIAALAAEPGEETSFSRGLDRLGISLEEARQILSGPTGIMSLLATAGARMDGNIVKLSGAFQEIVSNRYASSLATLAAKYHDFTEAIERILIGSTGAVQRQISVYEKRLAGAWERFQAMIDSFKGALGDVALNATLTRFFQTLGDLLEWLTEKTEDGKYVHSWLLSTISYTLLLMSTLLALGTVVRAITFALGSFGTVALFILQRMILKKILGTYTKIGLAAKIVKAIGTGSIATSVLRIFGNEVNTFKTTLEKRLSEAAIDAAAVKAKASTRVAQAMGRQASATAQATANTLKLRTAQIKSKITVGKWIKNFMRAHPILVFATAIAAVAYAVELLGRNWGAIKKGMHDMWLTISGQTVAHDVRIGSERDRAIYQKSHVYLSQMKDAYKRLGESAHLGMDATYQQLVAAQELQMSAGNLRRAADKQLEAAKTERDKAKEVAYGKMEALIKAEAMEMPTKDPDAYMAMKKDVDSAFREFDKLSGNVHLKEWEMEYYRDAEAIAMGAGALYGQNLQATIMDTFGGKIEGYEKHLAWLEGQGVDEMHGGRMLSARSEISQRLLEEAPGQFKKFGESIADLSIADHDMLGKDVIIILKRMIQSANDQLRWSRGFAHARGAGSQQLERRLMDARSTEDELLRAFKSDKVHPWDMMEILMGHSVQEAIGDFGEYKGKGVFLDGMVQEIEITDRVWNIFRQIDKMTGHPVSILLRNMLDAIDNAEARRGVAGEVPTPTEIQLKEFRNLLANIDTNPKEKGTVVANTLGRLDAFSDLRVDKVRYAHNRPFRELLARLEALKNLDVEVHPWDVAEVAAGYTQQQAIGDSGEYKGRGVFFDGKVHEIEIPDHVWEMLGRIKTLSGQAVGPVLKQALSAMDKAESHRVAGLEHAQPKEVRTSAFQSVFVEVGAPTFNIGAVRDENDFGDKATEVLNEFGDKIVDELSTYTDGVPERGASTRQQWRHGR